MATKKISTREIHKVEIVPGDQVTVTAPTKWLNKGPSYALRKTAAELEAQAEYYEKPVRTRAVFRYHPVECVAALLEALEEKFSNYRQAGVQSFFGEQPPLMYTVSSGPNTKMELPWGRLVVPDVVGYLSTEIERIKDKWCFVLAGLTRQDHKHHHLDLHERMETILRTRSLYKGKALQHTFLDYEREEGYNPLEDAPQFLDLSSVSKDKIVLNDFCMAQVERHLLMPLLNPQGCEEMGVPFRRLICLDGKPGTGKTLITRLVARVAEQTGVCSLVLNQGGHEQFERGVEFARAHAYPRAVLQYEDFDRISSGERDATMDKLALLMDGLNNKDDQVMIVVTTNNPESINEVIRRHGRIDQFIEVPLPDAKSAAKLLRLYGGITLEPGSDLSEAGSLLAGQNPAAMEAVVKGAKLETIRRLGKAGLINGNDLIASAQELLHDKARLEAIMNKKAEDPEQVRVKSYGEAMGFGLAAGLAGNGGQELLSLRERKQ